MQIAGLQKTSLIDFPDKVAAIIFTQGCCFNCGFCHNPELISLVGERLIPEREILEFLEKRKKVIDGLVITGGEPTLQADLKEFIKKVKNLGLEVKLDTNGVNPKVLKDLLTAGLLDYIAMDIKAPLAKYEKVINTKVKDQLIKTSIDLIMHSGVGYEFRSTILPRLHAEEDIEAMAQLISGAKRYYLQKFLNQGKLLDPTFNQEKAFTDKKMAELATICQKYVKECGVR
ncbi:MAG: anaerobic ribonucleoside-triphosphate reductase activating protein [Patescibacteria group bacterium]